MKILKKVLRHTLLVIGFLNYLNSQSIITGKVIDKSNGEAIIGATVRTSDSKFGTSTDFDGNYRLILPEGKYEINCNFLSYKIFKVNVEPKQSTPIILDITMEEIATEMEEIVVSYTIQKSSSLSQLIERRNSTIVSDGLSAEQIRKTPDRSASDALKRVTGTSIQEGKFAIIRGMNDRYNSGYLDGNVLPSTESDRKAFAFDILPTALIDKIQIIKSATADLSGDFGGGVIKISTKAIPDKMAQSINFGLSDHSITTFKAFTDVQKNSIENFGLLSNTRNLPVINGNELRPTSHFPTDADKISMSLKSKEFDLRQDDKIINAMPNTRFSYSLGKPFELSEGKRLGLIFAFNYSNNRKYQRAEIANFDGSGQTTALIDDQYNQNINSGGLLNLNFQSAKTQIGFNNLLNTTTEFNTINRTGLGNINDYIEVNNRAQLINHNRLNLHSINFRQVVGKEQLVIMPSIYYGHITRKIPSYKIVNYTKTPDYEQYQLAIGDFFNSSTGIFNSELDESFYGSNIDFSKKIATKNWHTDVKFGTGIQNRKREFESRNYVVNGQLNNTTMEINQDLASSNFSANQLYLNEKTSNELAYYKGDQELYFAFISIDQKYSKSLRMNYGIRNELFSSNLNNQKTNESIAKINQFNFLPSVNICYLMKEKLNARAAYFASVNRPEFRELAPFAFYAFDKNSEIRGNQNLKVAELNNFDLRLEYYPSGNQILSLGTFYKTIQNPIEFNIDISQVFTTFTYGNEKSAKIAGVEFEVKKNFDFLSTKDIFKEFSVLANLTLVKSSLSFNSGSQSSLNRPLQGQSPYIINIGLQYESEKTGWSVTSSVNRFGRRIAFVGVNPEFGATRQDIYEAPRTVVDFQIGKNYKKFNFKFTLGDILAQNLVFYQDADFSGKFESNIDRRIFLYKNGFTSSLSVSYNF